MNQIIGQILQLIMVWINMIKQGRHMIMKSKKKSLII